MNNGMVGARIKIMWEEQLVDPPKEYITHSRPLLSRYSSVNSSLILDSPTMINTILPPSLVSASTFGKQP